MNRVTLAAALIGLATFGTAHATPKGNKQAALAVSNAIAGAQLGAKADALLASDFKYHGPMGLELDSRGYVGFMAQLNASFSNMKMTFTHVLVQGDLVAVHYTNTFVFTAAYNGIPATQRPVTITGTFVRKVKAGKVVEEWDNPDLLGLMQQIGALPPPHAAK
jgi:predicted SnoaL-like aldol condensation-catalyzing enzyme